MRKIVTTKKIFDAKPLVGKNAKLPFSEYAKNVFSQTGEDGILEEIIKRIDPYHYYVDIGAWDGYHLSNVANLRDNHGWAGVSFEGNDNKVTGNNINLHYAFVKPDNINELIEKYEIPSEVGLLSVDIDGDDAYVFETCLKNMGAQIAIVEFNNGLPNNQSIRIRYQGEAQNNHNIHKGYWGANLAEMYDIAIEHCMEFVTTCGCNAIFVQNELFDKLGIERLSKSDVMAIHSKQGDYKYWQRRILKHDLDWEVRL